jgi:hypothetical protein
MENSPITGYPGVFSSEDVKLMISAYHDAFTKAQTGGSVVRPTFEDVAEFVARQIVLAAASGERDPARLRDAGLARLSISAL